MNISNINVGIIHSLIGKNDGVSIIIDHTVSAMVKYMNIDLGNIFFLAAHTSPRFNAHTDEVLWHKNEVHKTILNHYSEEPKDIDLDALIHEKAMYAKKVIAEFIEENQIDLIIAHNTTHPYNFITAVGLGYYIEELRAKKIIWPKLLVWWHDSYFERERFSSPNPVIKKYLRYLPGTYIDGIVFLNSGQPKLAHQFFEGQNWNNTDLFFRERTVIIPNTIEIPWDFNCNIINNNTYLSPPGDNYNDTFFKDIGLIDEITKKGYTLDETIIMLQHTRVVPRKNIELAIDFAFSMEKKFLENKKNKCFVILVSGHSGDEQVDYKNFLIKYYYDKLKENQNSNVVFLFGEDIILSHRDIIVDKKYYRFQDIPAIISRVGGIGTYFSELEGYGNNLLEMMAMGLPVVINKYDIYKSDIEQLGFDLPAIEDGKLTDELIDKTYHILTDIKARNKLVNHNLCILTEKLDHKLISDKIKPIIDKAFTTIL